MKRQILGVIIGVIGMFLWFMPLVSWEEKAILEDYTYTVYQTGYHIGGIAYLLLFSTFAYAAFSWLKIHPLRIISAAVALVICLLFLGMLYSKRALNNVDWGLIGLILVSIAGIVVAFLDYRSEKVKRE